MGFNDNQNKRINNFIVDELRLNPITDAIPKQVIPSIQPVFNVNQKICDVFGTNSTSSSNAGVTIFTSASNVDTYITFATIGLAKDATCDSTNGALNLNATINGVTAGLLTIPHVTLVATNTTITASFNPPISLIS